MTIAGCPSVSIGGHTGVIIKKEKNMKFEVSLNGTDKNPFTQLGLTQNPFPVIAKGGYESSNATLADLGARPIKDSDDIRCRLEGWSNEFIELCISNFVAGEITKFTVEYI